jgi:ATP-dependent Clp protease ATP-binding subunit ClpC
MVEDPLSEKLLYKDFRAGQTVIVDARDGEVVFEAPTSPETPPVELAGSSES